MTQMTQVTENELNERAVAPRVSDDALESNISCVNYFNVGKAIAQLNQPDHENHHLMTMCVIVLKNGFIVTGESACVSPENYQQDIGERIALANAKEKIWPLMGYAMRERELTVKNFLSDGDGRRSGVLPIGLR